MSEKNNRLALIALVFAIGAALACGPFNPLGGAQQAVEQAAATVAAVATEAAKALATPIAATPTKALATPIAATPTKAVVAAPTATPSAGLLAEALKKARAVTRYRMAMSFIVGATEKGKFKEEPFLVMEGVVVGSDSHQIYTAGLMNALLGGERIEMIQAGGKSYMKGGKMFGLGDPNKWYIMSETATSEPPVEPGDMFDLAGQDLQGLKQMGLEMLDAQPCQVWTWDMKAVAGLTSLLTNPDAQSDLSAVDKAEVKSWLCGDGYVHQVSMEIAGHDPKNPNEKGSIKIKTHIWDINNPTLSVKAPEGAVPLAP